MGSYLEAETVYLAVALFGAVLTAFALFAGRWTPTYDGFGDWALGQGAYATAVMLTLLSRVTGSAVWVVAANSCYLFFGLFLFRALWRFLGRPVPTVGRTPVLILVVAVCALPTMLLERVYRVSTISVLYALLWVACALLILRSLSARREDRPFWNWMVLWCVSMAIVVLVRVPLLLFFSGHAPAPEWFGWFNNGGYLFGGMANLALTLGYLALTQHRTAASLRASAEELQNLRRTLHEHAIFATTDAAGRLREVNDTFCAFTGYTRGELLGRTLDLLRPGVSGSFPPEQAEAMIRGRTWHGDECLRGKDGQPRWVASTLVPLVSLAGRTEGVALLLTDISARKAAEQEIAAQHERLQRSFAIGRMAWLELAPATGRLRVSATGGASLPRGLAEESDLAAWLAQVEPADRRVVEFGLDALQRGEKARLDVTFRLVEATGSWRWVRLIAQGDAVEVSGILQDVHEGKLEAERRREMEVQLLRSQKLANLGQFASGVAHDFNNLLQAIGGSVQLALFEKGVPAPARELLQVAQRGCTRATQLVERLLRFARGNPELELKLMSLPQFVNDSAPLLEAVLSRRHELVLRCDPAPTVRADEVKLLQVLVNLCVNGAHAIRDHAGRITIATGRAVEGGAWISVSDNGSGMSEAVQAQIFEPFFTTRPSGGGTGLGLAVVRGIVTEHGGRIEVRSRVGEGTTFTIRLPAAGTESAGAPPDSGRRGGSRRVLVVDDDPDTLRVVTATLQVLGHRVFPQGSVAAARAALADPALAVEWVLSDFTLLDGDGVTLLEEARQMRPTVRLALMSGDLSNVQAHLGRIPGVVTLAKPVEIAQLAAIF
jgi:PAS domain S-box-containing protein